VTVTTLQQRRCVDITLHYYYGNKKPVTATTLQHRRCVDIIVHYYCGSKNL